jgi:hypothetical protein
MHRVEYVTVAGLPPVSKVGLGTMRFGEKTFDPEIARALIRRALELGINCFDTAEVYGWGRGERLLGEALAAEGVTDAVVTSKYSPLLPLPAVIERHARMSGSLFVGGAPDMLRLCHPFQRRSLRMSSISQPVPSSRRSSMSAAVNSIAAWRG